MARELIARLPKRRRRRHERRNPPPPPVRPRPRPLVAARRHPARSAGAAATTKGEVRQIPVASIEPHPDQPRRAFDEAALDELAQSIAARGLIQPIVVRPHGHRFQIVAGERRWRAAQRARLHEIPAIVREFSDAETLEVALLENIQREDLNAIEEAEAYRRLIADYGHGQEALGKLVGKSRSHVANHLRLLDLPESVRAMVARQAAQHGPCPGADRRAGCRGAGRRGGAARPVGARHRKAGQGGQAERGSGPGRSNIRAPCRHRRAGAPAGRSARACGRHQIQPEGRAGDAELYQPRPARHDLPAPERREV